MSVGLFYALVGCVAAFLLIASTAYGYLRARNCYDDDMNKEWYNGWDLGWKRGYESGMVNGRQRGYSQGFDKGWSEGYRKAIEKAMRVAEANTERK